MALLRRLTALGLLLSAFVAQAQPAADPLEPLNRVVFGFNEAADRALLKPVATAYRKVVPSVVRTGVGNVYGNVADAWSVVNLLLQGKLELGLSMSARVIANTVFGLAGVFDVASDGGFERHSEDFGQTLGHWGVAPGPYLVLPLLGPSTLRDTLALPLDLKASLAEQVDPARQRLAVAALEVVHTRAGLLAATGMLDQIALDKYLLVREGHLARRRNLVFDGEPPDNESENKPAPAEGASPPAAQEAKQP